MNSTQGSFAIKRLAQELRDLQREPSPDYFAAPINVFFYFFYLHIGRFISMAFYHKRS